MNFLDQVASFLSPKWGYTRLGFRTALSGYEAARRDRLNSWGSGSGPVEQTVGPQRALLRDRSRDLEMNSDLARAAVGTIVRNVVGTGIRPQAQVKLQNGKLNDKLNRQIEALWNIWTRPQNCDVSGRVGFYEFQRIMLTRRIYDGESLCQVVTRKGKMVPLQLQGIEPEMLVEYMFKTPEGTDSNYIINGVELDEFCTPLAYHIQPRTPDGLTTKTPIRVPADNMLHLYQLERWSQVRGIPELAAVIRRMHETGEYLEAELLANKIAACFALFITRQNPGAAVGRLGQDSDGKRLDSIEPGMIEYLAPGESAQFATPSRPASAAGEITRTELRLIGAALGLSFEAISRDVSQTNYSSARVNLLEDRKGYRVIQQFMIEHFCQPIWERFIEAAVLSGAINLPGYWSDPGRYTTCRWVAPGWDWIDPLKETQAIKEQLKSGLTTMADALGGQGLDWQDVMKQAALERETAKQLGLPLDVFQPAAGSPPAPVKGDESDGETE